jgi:hypothetical protein
VVAVFFLFFLFLFVSLSFCIVGGLVFFPFFMGSGKLDWYDCDDGDIGRLGGRRTDFFPSTYGFRVSLCRLYGFGLPTFGGFESVWRKEGVGERGEAAELERGRERAKCWGKITALMCGGSWRYAGLLAHDGAFMHLFVWPERRRGFDTLVDDSTTLTAFQTSTTTQHSMSETTMYLTPTWGCD